MTYPTPRLSTNLQNARRNCNRSPPILYISQTVQHQGRNTRVRNTHRHAHNHFSHLTKPLNCINKWSSQHSTMVSTDFTLYLKWMVRPSSQTRVNSLPSSRTTACVSVGRWTRLEAIYPSDYVWWFVTRMIIATISWKEQKTIGHPTLIAFVNRLLSIIIAK